MSEYHSVSLVEHLPLSKPMKKSLTDHQQHQQHQQEYQQHQQQHRFNHHTFDVQAPNQCSSNSSSKHDISSIDDDSNNSFHSFGSLLNNMSTYNHTRHHTAPVNSNDYNSIYGFLPYDYTSHNLMVSNDDENNDYKSTTTTKTTTTATSIQLHESNDIFFNRDNKTSSNKSHIAATSYTTGSNTIHAIAGFNDHNHNMFSFNQNGSGKSRTIIPYVDEPKETSLMNSDLTTNFESTATSSPSPKVTHASSPVYRISNLSLVSQPTQTPSSLEMQSSTPSPISSSVSSRLMQDLVNENKMKPAIQAYLSATDPLKVGERTVIIMTSKVAQKSYGTEKRFLCPPPTAILVGSSWWAPPSKEHIESNQLSNGSFYDPENILCAPPSLTICMSGETTGHQSGRIEWKSFSGAVVGQTGGKLIQPVTTPKSSSSVEIDRESKASTNDDWYRNTRKEAVAGGRCVLKRLYINDADEKRKKVECLIKVQLANGLMLGTLSSRGIKVISKPSKKRQSVKNIELCIYHGTTVSLFNRIRSQNVSTKYLGVSSTSDENSLFDYPGRLQRNNTGPPNNDTCFVARTGSWDPFIVWVVDSSHHGQAERYNASNKADEYVGCPSLMPTIPYPNPPTIALKNRTNQPLAIRYNQHIVLQCLTTGLVSPVMIIRKVDKASTVVGGARCPDDIDPLFSGGGEFGDEVLGDPVSQLHKIALQIVHHESVMQQQAESQFQGFNHFNNQDSNMMPQMTKEPANYLACLNDLVGTHKTSDKRTPIKGLRFDTSSAAAAAVYENYNFTASSHSTALNSTLTRKRRVSMMDIQTNFGFLNNQQMQMYNSSLNEMDSVTTRRRMSSLNETSKYHHQPYIQRSHSISAPSPSSNRRNRMFENGEQELAEFGAYWSEVVADAAVWTIVGTECARYTFWTPPFLGENKQQENQINAPLNTLFPCLTHFVVFNDGYANEQNKSKDEYMMTIYGENFTRDLQIWFGDIKAPFTEYRSREMLVCGLPSRDELLRSIGLNRVDDTLPAQKTEENKGHHQSRSPFNISILLIRGDGVVYKTGRSYSFS